MKIALFQILIFLSGFATAEPLLFINQQQGSVVSVFRGKTLEPVGTVQVVSGPAGVTLQSNESWAAVSHPEEGVISFIDGERLLPLLHLNVEGSPFGLASTKDRVFYTDWNADFVGVVDPLKNRILKHIPVGKSPAGIVAIECRGLVIAANRESDSVSVIDMKSLDVTRDIKVGEAPFALDYDKDFVYVVNARSNSLSVIDLDKLQEVHRVSTGRMPYGVAVDPIRHRVFVANQMENSVTVFDRNTLQVTATLETGSYPENLAVDEGNGRLYVLNWFDSTLSVFDTGTLQQTDQLTLSEGSRAFGDFVQGPLPECN